MTAFVAFCLWLLACYLLASRHRPLQPDKLEDSLGTVDLRRHGRDLIDNERING